MNYLNQYKSFINSQHITEGLRMTAGVIIPALTLGYFGNISIGILLSLGALMVSITDSPGPVHHRRNGMAACIIFIFFCALLTGLVSIVPVALTCYLVAVCFFFSMITIYGTRATSIGTVCMIIIILTIDPKPPLITFSAIFFHAVYIATGALWYMCYSLVLYNFRPYRIAQQALGDCIEATAEYLRFRSFLFVKNPDYNNVYNHIFQQQVIVQQKQNDLSELLFKTRSLSKESTPEGRTLVMMFLDLTDIFEKIMVSHQHYQLLHTYFDETGILSEFKHLAEMLAGELNELGIAVKSGHRSKSFKNISSIIEDADKKLESLSNRHSQHFDKEGIVSLRQIIENIKDISERIKILQQYDITNKKPDKNFQNIDIKKLTTSQDYSFELLRNNLSFKSDTFRHAIRMSVAILAGFLVSLFFKTGHSYWVLLTVVVILKPAYSLTKKRNGQRLAGTVTGIGTGMCILYINQNSTILLVLLILCMLGSFSAMRRNYFISVLFMTAYLVIFYHLLSPADFKILLQDRIVDTIIGSIIAFAASYLLFPLWEKDKMKFIMVTMLNEISKYFTQMIEGIYNNDAKRSAQQLARKNALVALANLSDSFNRMLSEPESRQQGIKQLHKFVVLNHMLTSYIAGFSQSDLAMALPADALNKSEKHIKSHITNAVNFLLQENKKTENFTEPELEENFNILENLQPVKGLKPLIDQLSLVHNVVADIDKVTKEYMAV